MSSSWSIASVADRTDARKATASLTDCEWIAEKHGGSISLSSTPGRSTELTIQLPLEGRDEP